VDVYAIKSNDSKRRSFLSFVKWFFYAIVLYLCYSLSTVPSESIDTLTFSTCCCVTDWI
jgi:uncharacterized membrane protein YbhN (UPF0104 family)